MAIEAIKKKYPIRDENGQPSTYPTFASQVFREDGTPLERDGLLQGMLPLDVYPIGSIYMSVSDTDPAMLFGGTWVKLENQFLLGAGSGYALGDTGGEAEVLLTEETSVTHTHGTKSLTGQFRITPFLSGGSNNFVNNVNGVFSRSVSGTEVYKGQHIDEMISTRYDTISIDASHEHTAFGGNQPHNNMPPYLVVNMWKRIADEEVA